MQQPDDAAMVPAATPAAMQMIGRCPECAGIRALDLHVSADPGGTPALVYRCCACQTRLVDEELAFPVPTRVAQILFVPR